MEYEKLLDEIKQQTGTYPYNKNNPLKGDSYYMQIILEKYPVKWIERAIDECNIIQMEIVNSKNDTDN